MSASDPPFPVRDDPASNEGDEGSDTQSAKSSENASDTPDDRQPGQSTPPRSERSPGLSTPRPSTSSWRPTQSRPWERASDRPSTDGAGKDAAPAAGRDERVESPSAPAARSEFAARPDLPSSTAAPSSTETPRPDPNLRPDPPVDRPRPTISGDPSGIASSTPAPMPAPPRRPDPFRRPDDPGERRAPRDTEGVHGASPASTEGADPEALTRPLPSVSSTGTPTTERPRLPGSGELDRDGSVRPRSDPASFRQPGGSMARPADAPPRPANGPARIEPRVQGPATLPLPVTDRPRVPGGGTTTGRPEVEALTGRTQTDIDRAVAKVLREPAEPRPEPGRAHVVTPTDPRGRATQRLVRIPAGSAFRVSLVFYLLLLVLWLVFASVLFLLLQNTGVVENIESFYGELLGYKDVQFHFGPAFLFSAVAGLIWVFLASVSSAFMALVYNRVSRFVGGLKVVVEDDEPNP